MKIVQLVFTLGPGGGAKFVTNLSNELAEMGHEVYVMQVRNDQDTFDIYFNKKFLSSKVKYLNLGLTKGFSLKKALTVMKSIIKLRPNIVHSHLNVLPYYYLLTPLPLNIKFIHTLHSVAEKETEIKWQQKINHWIYKYGLITPITISDECRLSFIDLYKLPSPICINNGTPPMQASSKIKLALNELNKLKSTHSSKIFLHVARFDEAKNQGMLIDSFNQLCSDNYDVELVIIGDRFDTPEGIKLQHRACNRIHFIGTRPNIGDYMLNSDFFVLSSLWEGLPISLIEALSARLTPISTPAGGIPNVIKDGQNGFLSADFNKESYIHTIKRALVTPVDSDVVYNSYLEKFAMDICAKTYEKTYNS